jgi:hypothetical protein
MAYVVRFAPTAMSEAQYDECIQRLEAAGAGAPAGRDYHVCFKADGKLHVSDIWNSMEEFEQFGQTLMPILRDLGIDAGQPVFLEVHNSIRG